MTTPSPFPSRGAANDDTGALSLKSVGVFFTPYAFTFFQLKRRMARGLMHRVSSDGQSALPNGEPSGTGKSRPKIRIYQSRLYMGITAPSVTQ